MSLPAHPTMSLRDVLSRHKRAILNQDIGVVEVSMIGFHYHIAYVSATFDTTDYAEVESWLKQRRIPLDRGWSF